MRTLILLCLLALLPTLARAEPPTDKSIEQLLFVTRSQESVDSMMTMLRAGMKRMTAALPPATSEEKKKLLEAMETRSLEVIASELSWEKMRPVFVSIYRDTFTQEEIDGLIAFYQSPAGTAYIEKMPLIREKTMQLMQQRMAPLMAKMNAATEDLKAQLKAAN